VRSVSSAWTIAMHVMFDDSTLCDNVLSAISASNLLTMLPGGCFADDAEHIVENTPKFHELHIFEDVPSAWLCRPKGVAVKVNDVLWVRLWALAERWRRALLSSVFFVAHVWRWEWVEHTLYVNNACFLMWRYLQMKWGVDAKLFVTEVHTVGEL